MPWTETPLTTPKSFAGQVPVFQVIKAYLLETGEERIEVRRAFANCQEATHIIYEGPALEERVQIFEGKIAYVYCQYPAPQNLFYPKMTKRQLLKAMGEIFNPKKPEEITYYNIKRLETQLKELPWQEDLKAIYEGSGVYK